MHRFPTLLALATALLPLLTFAASTPLPAERIAYLDQQVDAAAARYHLPGMAVGVIDNGQIVYTRTLGERVVGSGEKIDGDTLFKIASLSKAMTTALLGRLVDEGKLDWDDKVTKYLPGFKMYEPKVTKQMRVADLLTHSSGLRYGSGDLMLWPDPNDFTRADIIHALRYFPPAYRFRTEYHYDNLLYVVAGELAAKAGGASYETLMHREVFAPLGLNRCQVGRWDRDAIGNVAEPHGYIDGHNQVIRADGPVIPASAADPAGGIRCSLDDMLRWAQNWLAPTPAQLHWLSAKQRKVLQSPHIKIPVPALARVWSGTTRRDYGYGWRMNDVDGQWAVWHTGTLSGMYAELWLLPDARSGFVLLINGNGGQARTVLGETLKKFFTQPSNTQGVAGYGDKLDTIIANAPTRRNDPNLPDSAAMPPVSAAAMAGQLGIYRDPWLGQVSICARDGFVHFASEKSPRLAGVVVHDGDRDLVRWDDRSVDPDAWLDFHQGNPIQLTMAKLDPYGDASSDFEDLHFVRERGCE
ncbi:serine hydrolase [Solimonas marina]|uniref:Serine hydrolase n=1 Tax=Solimonas marina TaxID=2714601 RepID=A0A969WA84_9GAMM|nr:serine hydrolase [Solimonas marina]NKF22858.1 serine hydrolase [Solimonas marina]